MRKYVFTNTRAIEADSLDEAWEKFSEALEEDSESFITDAVVFEEEIEKEDNNETRK